MPYKFTKLFVAITLVSLAWVNLASAQEQTNLPAGGTTEQTQKARITAEDFRKAQESKAACDELGRYIGKQFASVYKTEGLYKTAFFPAGYSFNGAGPTRAACHIVQSSFPTNGRIVDISRAAADVEKNLLQSKEGIALELPQKSARDQLGEFLGGVIAYLFRSLTLLFIWVTSLAGHVLDWAITKGVIHEFPPSVVQGWRIVRDVFNMFFILAMIVMALGTMLRRGDFNYKTMLRNIIVMALLVNFSMVICLTLIQVSNGIAMTMAKEAKLTDYTATAIRILSPEGNHEGVIGAALASTNTDAIRAGSGFFLGLIMMSAYVAMAFLLVVRYIGLLLLTVLAPAAFTLYIFPGKGAEVFRKWRDYFVKYLIWLPVAVFFLRLGHIFLDSNTDVGILGSSATNPDLTLLLSAGFYWGAFWITKGSGIMGAATVAGWGQMAANYVGRGTALKRVGQLTGGAIGWTANKAAEGTKYEASMKKGTERLTSALSAPGKGWEHLSQARYAAPKVVKDYLDKGEKEYQKGVSEKVKNWEYQLGIVESKEMLKNSKDAARYYADKLKDSKYSTTDLEEDINNTPLKSMSGLMDVVMRPEFNDDPRKEVAEELILKKMGVQRLKDGHTIFKELPRDEKGKLPKGETGYAWVDPDDHSKGMDVQAVNVNRDGKEKSIKRRLNANIKPTELELLNEEQRAKAEALYAEKQRELQKFAVNVRGLASDPDRDRKLTDSEVKGRIPNPAQRRYAKEVVDAFDAEGDRVDVPKTLVTNVGSVIINPEAAKAWGLEKNQDSIVTQEEFSEFAKILEENGGISQEDLAKIRETINKVGSVPVQYGLFRGLQPVIKEALGEEYVKSLKNLRQARGDQKMHEGYHRLVEYMKRSSKESDRQAYKTALDKIMSFDKKKFEELKAEIKSNPAYKDYTDADIAEEIIAERKHREKLDPKLLDELKAVTEESRKNYLAAVRAAAKNIRLQSRAGTLTKGVVSREPDLESDEQTIIRRL